MAGRRPRTAQRVRSYCVNHMIWLHAPLLPLYVPQGPDQQHADDMGPFQLYVTSIAIWGEAMSEAERVVLQARRAVGNRAASATDKQEALQALLSWQGSRGARCFTTAHAIR